MGERARALDRLREAADELLVAASSLGDEERVEFRRQLNRCEVAFAISTTPLARACIEEASPDGLSPVQVLRYDCKMVSS